MSSELSIEQLIKLVMKQAQEKGFGTSVSEINVPEKIALIHSEVSEAFEAYRHKNIQGKDGLAEELGDAIQRILHLCGVLEIDIQSAILSKLDYNKDREWNWEEMNEKHTKTQT